MPPCLHASIPYIIPTRLQRGHTCLDGADAAQEQDTGPEPYAAQELDGEQEQDGRQELDAGPEPHAAQEQRCLYLQAFRYLRSLLLPPDLAATTT